MAVTMRRAARSLIVPLLYFASVVPVVVGIVLAFYSMEYGGLLYRYVEPLYRYDGVTPTVDEIGLATVLVIGGVAFGLFGWVLTLFERLWRPKPIDHLRRRACFYVSFAILSVVLAWQQRRFGRVGYGGGTA